jgi:hypothetical protein
VIILSRIRGNGNLLIHWKWRVDNCVSDGCSDTGIVGDAGLDLWAVVQEQESPRIRPLSNRAPYTERAGCGKKQVSRPIRAADEGGVRLSTGEGSDSIAAMSLNMASESADSDVQEHLLGGHDRSWSLLNNCLLSLPLCKSLAYFGDIVSTSHMKGRLFHLAIRDAPTSSSLRQPVLNLLPFPRILYSEPTVELMLCG